jgi:xylan 1,4-beta-xylosidase
MFWTSLHSFYTAAEAEQWQPVAEAVDGRILSPPVAGGFVGAYIGMYASSNGISSQNRADFDWFEYQEIPF